MASTMVSEYTSPGTYCFAVSHDDLWWRSLLKLRTPGVVFVGRQAREGQATEALFWRQGAPLTLPLTPQRWAGRGLLGCHLRPL